MLAGVDSPWTGRNTHQRLFVAVAELLRLAAATTGAVLAIDDIQDADEATLRLLHYLPRPRRGERRSCSLTAPGRRRRGRSISCARACSPATRASSSTWRRSTAKPSTSSLPATPEASAEQRERIATLAHGNPYMAIELASGPAGRRGWPTWMCSPSPASLPRPGSSCSASPWPGRRSTSTSSSRSGLPNDEAFAQLDHAIALRILEPADAGFRFRHRLVRDALLEDLPPIAGSASTTPPIASRRSVPHRPGSATT